MLAGAAAGLAAAHRRGILHRDLKPANIMLARDAEHPSRPPADDIGTVKLVDFGIARSIMGEVRPHDGATLAPALTGTGMVLGTPAYASPEQLAGEPLDARSDIYSLGLVAFEVLTGEPAFEASDARQLIAERLMGSARTVAQVMSRSAAPWGDAVQPVLDRALAARAEHRYADPMEFATDLAAALGVPLTTSGPYGQHTPSGEKAEATSAAATTPARRRRTMWVALAVGAILITAVSVFLWRAPRRIYLAKQPIAASSEDGSQRIAVLPFENLGRPEDAYVVDGITDEIRGKLAGVPGLQLIARASSNEYRGTKKPLQDVARELGVQYLLTGTVRSEPAAKGQPARVRVTPELVEVGAADVAPSSKWTQSLDATMADVFAMQADIAGRVAGAMNVALAGVTRARLAEVPTHDPAAYDAYLRGKAITKTDPVDLRRRLGYFQQAVALDSTFLLAWAERARVASMLYSNGVPDPALAREGKAAAERAIALAPLNGIGYGVLATYKNLVEHDPAAALTLAEKARTLSPGDPELLRPLAIAERQQGRIGQALQYMRDAVQRDPRNATTVHLYGDALLWARQYDASREAADRALSLSPDVSEMIENRAMVSLAQGDLAAARRVLAVVPSSVDRAVLAAAVAMYYDLPWLLDDSDQRRLLALGPDAFDGDRMSWAWALSQTYTLRGDDARARAYADTALVAVDEQLRDAPDDAQRHLVRALLLATLGRKNEAVAAGEHGMGLEREEWTATNGPYLQHQLARVYMLVGQNGKALDQLEPLLRDAVLPVARLAEDRSDLRPAARGAAVRATDDLGAGGRSGDEVARQRHSELRRGAKRRREDDQTSARTPAVSVIVPTYNRLPLLRETMASVLDQTFGDLELIVVDDGSTDGTAEHVRAMSDPRVRLVALSHGGNVSRALNAGVAASRARWLCVLGSDDVWLPTKLERQMRETRGGGYALELHAVRADGRQRRADAVALRRRRRRSPDGSRRALLADELGVTICAVMMERALVDEVGGFREQFPFRQDFDLVVRIALRAPAHAVDESLVRARQHTGRTDDGDASGGSAAPQRGRVPTRSPAKSTSRRCGASRGGRKPRC